MAITLDGTTGTTTPALTNSALTSGRVTYAGTSGVLQDSSDITFNGTSFIIGAVSATNKLLLNTSTTPYGHSFVIEGGSSQSALMKTNTSTNDVITTWNTATSGNNTFISFNTDTSITSRGNITYNRVGGLVAYNTTSDYRAKDIFGPVTNSGELIDSVPVYMGKIKGATQERPMFIAHEVPSFACTGEKDAVDKDGNPVYQQMDASALVPILWAELKSMRARIAALEAK